MRKILVIVVTVISFALMACGSRIESAEITNDVLLEGSTDESRVEAVGAKSDRGQFEDFVVVMEPTITDTYYVVYDPETMVMYVVSHGVQNCGVFTVLVNSDGTPRLYRED